jgi:hypothetical protein
MRWLMIMVAVTIATLAAANVVQVIYELLS